VLNFLRSKASVESDVSHESSYLLWELLKIAVHNGNILEMMSDGGGQAIHKV
jgi:hypothetical protein